MLKTALKDPGIKPGGGWNSCGVRQLQPGLLSLYFSIYVHICRGIQQMGGKLACIAIQVAVGLNKSQWPGLQISLQGMGT